MSEFTITDDGLIDATSPEGDAMIALAELPDHDCHNDPEDGCAGCEVNNGV